MNQDFTEGLNEAQRRAVEHSDGPLLLLAGAGSGKTKTLTHRIARLVAGGVPTGAILAVTFTNKAAKEMRERLAGLLGERAENRSFMPWMGTFHGICVRLLRFEGEHAGIPKNFVILDESDKLGFVKQVMKELNISEKNHSPRSIAGSISSAKNEGVSASEYARTAQLPFQKVVADVFPRYEAMKKRAKALDFDDLLIESVRLFESVPELREKWQRRFAYIMVDEYQDTNKVQYRLIKLLANETQNVCVVGDDWQCFPPGTLVRTPGGARPIEEIKPGDTVVSAAGYGKTADFAVTGVNQSVYKGELVKMKLVSGAELVCTPNHLLFSRWDQTNFVPQATSRGARRHVTVNAVLFGDKRTSATSPWSASRLSVNTTDPSDLGSFVTQGYTVRSGRAGTVRSEIHNLDYGTIEQTLEVLQPRLPEHSTVRKYAFLTEKRFEFTPAAHIHPGMLVPVYHDGKVVAEQVEAVEKVSYSGPVYDLNVDKVHNYIAANVVVHNSIYSWRGADFTNILNFERDFPGATVIKLEKNYRSTKPILDAAHNVITKNTQRTDKKLTTDQSGGLPVQVIHVSSEVHEAEAIVSRIKMANDTRLRRLSDFVVLYRTNAQSRALEEGMMRYGVPYKMIGGTRFYDRAEVKDILSYLRLVYQPSDRASFTRIVNVPTRGLGAVSVEKFLLWAGQTDMTLVEALDQADLCPGLTPRARNSLKSLGDTIQNISRVQKEYSLAKLIELVIKKIGYLAYLDDGSIKAEERQANVKELVSDAEDRPDIDLQTYLEEVALVSALDDSATQDAVTLMTLHGAKGLEFPVVFMAGMEEGLFPQTRALYDQQELEEERRLCYVGMTRARQELYLLCASSRLVFGNRQYNPQSRFIDDMEVASVAPSEAVFGRYTQETEVVMDDEMGIEVGDHVQHQLFGKGVVQSIDGQNITIRFGSKGIKTLNAAFAPLRKL